MALEELEEFIFDEQGARLGYPTGTLPKASKEAKNSQVHLLNRRDEESKTVFFVIDLSPQSF